MSELRITDLDFTEIKTNLKNYLRSQEEFADYDFDGAGLNVLLDILAYNTHYNAILTHLQANEMFIDTAIKRSSVVSIAKTLGYIPRSSTSARARLNIVATPSGTNTDTTLTLVDFTTAGTLKFTGTVNNTTYTFNIASDTTVTKADGVFTFEDLDVYEGAYIQNSFLVTAENLSGPFVIPNQTIDISTLRVNVQTSSTDITVTSFNRSTTITDIDPTDNVFWLEENVDGNYQILFGDNIIGKQLEFGNIVNISYLSCNGPNANGIRTFELEGSISGIDNIEIELVNPSASGSFKETIDEIRFNAPKFNATRNRAVTAQDYQSLILSQFSRAKSVAVWGGEENDPPIYGKVFITLDPKDGEVITESDKDFISETILRPRSVLSIQHEFIDPDYLYVGFEVDIKYDRRLTTLTASQIKSEVQTGIQTYFTTNLQTLEKTFIYSQFVDFIKSLLPDVIVGVLAKMRVQRRLDITAGLATSTTVRFLTSLVPETIKSTTFSSIVNEISYDAYIQDFANTNTIEFNGTGTLKLLEANTQTILVNNLGTVDYQTGVVTINNLVVDSFFGEATELRINAIPQELGKNISPTVIRISETSEFATSPAPSRNSIITLDDSEADTLSNLTAGVSINVSPFISNT